MKQLIIFISFLIFIYACSVGVRYHQHIVLSTDDVILTTDDGYRWLRYAEYVRDGVYRSGDDRLAGVDGDKAQMPPDAPLLSVMLSGFDDMRTSGSLFTVFLSGLFIFPLGMFFYFAGFPAAGLGASLVGSLSFAYLSRTSAYQIDTDMLILFFVSMGALSVYMAERGRSIMWAFVAGVTMYLFWRWYFHSGYTVVYLFLLLYALRGKPIKVILASGFMYVLASSPFVLMDGFRDILHFAYGGGAVSGAYADVSENTLLCVSESLARISSFWWLAGIGLFLSLLVKRQLVYLTVFYMLGVLTFFKGVRFDMYLAPVCGAGLGVVADYLLRGRMGYLGWGIVIACLMLTVKPYLDVVPPRVVEKTTYDTIKKLNSLESDAVIGTMWDKGFLVEYLTGRAVLADGASQFKSGNRLYAKSMISDDPVKVAERLSHAVGGRPLYLFFTPDMSVKLDQIIESAECHFKRESGDILILCGDKAGVGGGVSLQKTLYFRMFVIGDADIEGFQKIFTNHRGFSLYKISILGS